MTVFIRLEALLTKIRRDASIEIRLDAILVEIRREACIEIRRDDRDPILPRGDIR